jgi:hypothetical protein
MSRQVGTLIFILIISSASVAEAQLPTRPAFSDEIPRQSIFVELGGNGLIYSLNYDVLFQSNWGFRLGGAFFPADFFNDTGIYENRENSTAFLGIVMGYRALGAGSHKIEIGSGLLFGTIYDRQKWDYPEPPGATFSLGYRFFPEDDGKVTFRAAFTPVINRSGFHPRIGISLGITLTPEGNAR